MEASTSQFEELLSGAMVSASKASSKPHLPPNENPLLNGLPYRTYRKSISISERRAAGTFFTGPKLARLLAERVQDETDRGALVMDPTCGIGDLLLAYAELLPLGDSLSDTLISWGQQLAGSDLNPDLVNMTKARLVMLARARGGFRESLSDFARVFPDIVVGDMIQQSHLIKRADAFLFNPPFGMTSDYRQNKWATGLINAAANFLCSLVEMKRNSAPIVAVLPEVLRCGSRYAAFRQHLESLGVAGNHECFGRFDAWTDVDVFVSTLTFRHNPNLWRSISSPGELIGDVFEIKVGPVVPHRHGNVGGWHPYICAKTTPRWAEAFVPQRSRRFRGTVFKPPFVVIRRTSSPSDRVRAIGSIIAGDRCVAVENHLVVLQPKSGSIIDCQRVMPLLKDSATTEFLNREMRCRHLTTRAIASIPWIKT